MNRTYRILIIEDNPASATFYQKHLEVKGYETIVASTGSEGLTLARQEKPDLILLDLLLPNIDGWKVCRMLKFDRDLKPIPVAILTSRDTEEAAEMAKACGADAFLLKTTRIEIVLDVIQKLLEKTQ